MFGNCLKAVATRFLKLSNFKQRPNLQNEGVMSSNLLDMPLDVINVVMGKLEPMDLLRLRKVCHSLKSAVNKFGIHFDSIHFELHDHSITLCLDNGFPIYIRAVYGGTTVSYGQRTIEIEEENFMDVGFKDLKFLLKHVSTLGIYNYAKNRKEIIKSFIDFLKPEECFPVDAVEIWNFSFNDVVSFLSYFDDKTLKSIKLNQNEPIEQFEPITYLDQWTNAKHFGLKATNSNVDSEIIKNLFHFPHFCVYKITDFPTQLAVKIRDNLMRRSTFQQCTLSVNKLTLNPIEIARIFKSDYTGGKEYKFKYSNGTHKFEISLVQSTKCIYVPFIFSVKRL
ncbi:F-box domain-containing protein [Caenorhabditis elegans]|uniref:F-box domain-containing protein n=1 Tax=Caenorhabditis elegans TaxID=6239 RepID=Q9TXM9_CAEEL|nr:F-box domain-containing protein [Caenorhabditis elegans]NP_508358.2 F-box domain-containing protein [Caenorhabditis elegans]CCD71640.1 F-box domain-containing protein [Caenorhabditis elegans]CCD71653.2 F-box domain-containing protein [Caenorhabditis elegans]|eukprot:NP_508358.2 F-box A protein [Caenorhabditis elegans]